MPSIKTLKKTILLLPLFMMGLTFAQTGTIQTASYSSGHSGTQNKITPSLQSLDELALIAEQFLGTQVKNIAGTPEIIITPLDRKTQLPFCAKPVPYLSHGARTTGRTTVAIRCDDPQPWKVILKANVKIHAEYIVPNKTLPHGHHITEADLTTVTGDITAMRQGILTTKEHIIGRTVVRSMQAGSPIWPENLKAPKAIQSGQNVRIISQGQGFSITAEGQALTSVNEGQIAQVRMENGRIIRGIAREGGIVEINF